MSDYYPPSETAGGWLKNEDPQFIRSLGMVPEKLKEFGRYNLHDVPEESGYASWDVHIPVFLEKLLKE